MLYKGENSDEEEKNEDIEAKRDSGKHLKANLLKHQEEVIAIKEAIKPGFIAMFCQAFDKEMVRKYLEDLSDKEFDEKEDLSRMKEKIVKEVEDEHEIESAKRLPTAEEKKSETPIKRIYG